MCVGSAEQDGRRRLRRRRAASKRGRALARRCPCYMRKLRGRHDEVGGKNSRRQNDVGSALFMFTPPLNHRRHAGASITGMVSGVGGGSSCYTPTAQARKTNRSPISDQPPHPTCRAPCRGDVGEACTCAPTSANASRSKVSWQTAQETE